MVYPDIALLFLPLAARMAQWVSHFLGSSFRILRSRFTTTVRPQHTFLQRHVPTVASHDHSLQESHHNALPLPGCSPSGSLSPIRNLVISAYIFSSTPTAPPRALMTHLFSPQLDDCAFNSLSSLSANQVSLQKSPITRPHLPFLAYEESLENISLRHARKVTSQSLGVP